MNGPTWLDHKVTRQDRADGTIVLGSGLKLGPVARNTGEWLHRWADETPNNVYIAERNGQGWREVTFGEMLKAVRTVAEGLLAQGAGPGAPIVVLSGPSVDHGILALAAQYIGAPLVPLAEQYSLIEAAYDRLRYCAGKVRPVLVYAADGNAYGAALSLPVFDGCAKVVSTNSGEDMMGFNELMEKEPGPEVDEAYAKVGPDTVAKILFTSGSTSDPKGVPQTQAMMCVNQAQYLACLPILGAKRHKMLDWLPWNHVFAGSSDFNMMLANGGALYLDDGKPVGPLAKRSLENLRMHPGTLSFNVPVAHAMQVTALKDDAELRRRYFENLDIFFYAGASLPADVWSAIETMAVEERGEMVMMMSSWGMTETAPCALIYHEKGAAPGMIGVPVPELEVKLIPIGDNRYELRVRGPNVFTGYFEDEKRTAESFDDEGFFITGDAVNLVDPDDASRGLRFDGRIGEDFKLTTGIWVKASMLRLAVLAELAGLAQDVVITGEGRGEVGLLIFPPAGRALANDGEAVTDAAYLAEVKGILARLAESATGSSNRIARAIALSEPPHVGDGEITAKGSLNVRTIITRRATALARLYDDADPATIRI